LFHLNCLRKKCIYILVSVIILAIGGCSEAPKNTPTTTITQTRLPASPTSRLTISPTPSASLTPTITLIPTKTPLQEGSIVLNWGHSAVPMDSEGKSNGDKWAQGLSKVSGLNVVLIPGPSTDLEILQSLRDGKIQMAELNALSFVYGQEQGWIMAGPVLKYTYQPDGRLMFVARTDSGLIAGDSEQMYRQLEGKRPCWPGKDFYYAPIYEYIAPAGLLAQKGIKLGQPVFVTHPKGGGYREAEAVFLKECDFAVFESYPVEGFMSLWFDDLESKGVTSNDWKNDMQVLYYTTPLVPYHIMAFSSQLESSKRELLTQALLSVPGYYSELHWIPYDAEQEAFYDQFYDLVIASEVDVTYYLSQADKWLQDIIATASTPSSTPNLPSIPNTNALVIDVSLTDGGSPWLPFSVSASFLNRLIMPAIYAELIRMDADGNYFPYLAQDLPTLDNGLVRFTGQGEDKQMEVEFHLRPGVSWQDGEPLTAEDLAFSWELVMQKDWPGSHYNGSDLASEVYVQEVQAISPDKVVYRFMSQRQARQAAQTGGRLNNPSLYASLAKQDGPVVPLDYLNVGRNVLPKHLLADIPAGDVTQSDFAQHPVFAGAYRLVQGGNEGQPVVLEAFDNFALGAPSIPQVVFGAVYSNPQASTYWQSPEALGDAFQAGVVQAQLGLPGVNSKQGEDPGAYDALSSQGLAQVNWVERNAWETLDFNLDNPHLSDLKVRQAIAHAIDRQAIINLALEGHGSLMRSYLPNWHPYHAGDDALPDYNFDPELARSLLREAGYILNQFPAIHSTRGALVLNLDSMDVASYPRPATAELIKKELADIGIQVNIRFYSFTDFEGQDCSAVRNGRRFDLGMAGWIGVSRYDTWYVEHVTASNSIPTTENGCPYEKANWSGWRNARADEIIPMLEDGRLALEHPDEYRSLWVDHQQLWATDLPSLPLFNWQRPVVTATGLHGVQPSPFFSQGVEDTWNIFEWVWK
jgi:peptide/nickel transport system substrate-binding protein